jgi:hypothetical protein
MPHFSGKKSKPKVVKPVNMTQSQPDTRLQYDIPKGVEEDKKVKPKDVFVDYKLKKKKSNKK